MNTKYSPSLSAVLSFVIPGLGQVYNGQIGKGVLVFFTSWLVFPWLLGIVDAYKVAQRINNGDPVAGPRIGVVVGIAIGMIAVTIFILAALFITAIFLMRGGS